jgi:UDP-glucose 4-epimerase
MELNAARSVTDSANVAEQEAGNALANLTASRRTGDVSKMMDAADRASVAARFAASQFLRATIEWERYAAVCEDGRGVSAAKSTAALADT